MFAPHVLADSWTFVDDKKGFPTSLFLPSVPSQATGLAHLDHCHMQQWFTLKPTKIPNAFCPVATKTARPKGLAQVREMRVT